MISMITLFLSAVILVLLSKGRPDQPQAVFLDVDDPNVSSEISIEIPTSFTLDTHGVFMTLDHAGWLWTDGTVTHVGSETRVPCYLEADSSYPLPPTKAEIEAWIESRGQSR